MKTTVTESAIHEAFRDYDRHDQFGHEALGMLFDYFEELEADTGEELELDVIAICCDYSVDTVADIANSYDVDIADMDEDEAQEAVMDYLRDNTSVVGECSDGRIVYCSAF
jgi:hypothetical protein